MKVLIITEGGKNIGFGHITRCVALAQGIKEYAQDVEIGFLISGDDSVKIFLRKEGFNIEIEDWAKKQQRLMSMVKGSDLVVIDSYLAPKSVYDDISSAVLNPLLMLDDYKRIDYPKGIVVNPSIYKGQFKHPQKDELTYLLGGDYIILRKEFWEMPDKVINKKVKDILITFGGTDHSDFMKKLLNILSANFSDFTYHIITNFSLNFSINLNLKLYSDLSASEVCDLMLKADISISAGGQTTHELARVGVPTIGICFAENQKVNLTSWETRGFLDYAGEHNTKEVFPRLMKSMFRFMDYKEREKRCRIGRNCVDGKGSMRIIREALDARISV